MGGQRRRAVREDQGRGHGERGDSRRGLPGARGMLGPRGDHDLGVRIVLPVAGLARLQRRPAERQLQVRRRQGHGGAAGGGADDCAGGLQRARRIDHRGRYDANRYYEDHGFGARLAYTYRSHFFVGLDRSTPQYQDDTGTLAASLSYNVTRNVSLNFDALNLNDPILKYYGANKDQPRAFYANGRQYYFTVRIKL